MLDPIITFLKENKDPLTVLLSFLALLVSFLAFIRPSIKEWRDRRTAIFQSLQGDRKAIAIVTLRVLRKDWDSRLKRKGFREQLLQSLAIAIGLEGSDRGKAYVLAALKHIGRLGYHDEVVKQLEHVKGIFEEYVNTGADLGFRQKRVVPLDAILKSLRHP